MSEFILNTANAARAYDTLSDFAKGFIEAAFFCETSPAYDSDEWFGAECQEAIAEGTSDGNIPGDSDVGDIAPTSLAAIAAFCAEFQGRATEPLAAAYATGEYDEAQAGRDLYFTRAGHGVGFTDREPLKVSPLNYETAARAAGWFPDRNNTWRHLRMFVTYTSAQECCEAESIEPQDDAEAYEELTATMIAASKSGDNAAWSKAFDARKVIEARGLGERLSTLAGRGEINLFANEDAAAESGFVIMFEGI